MSWQVILRSWRYKEGSIELIQEEHAMGPKFDTQDAARLFMYLHPQQWFERGVDTTRVIRHIP